MRRLLIVFAAACGSPKPPPTPSGPPAAMEAPRASADDVIVAHVDGRPVWGSCVVIQARRGASRDVALRQCVDFELLAQAADRRGFASHAEVALATRTAMVSELVARAYEDGYMRPEQFGAEWNTILAKTKLVFRWQHEEYRASSYVRVVVAPTASQAEDDAAHVLADKIATALAPERGLLGPQLVELAQRIAGPVALFHQDVPLYKIGALEDAYGDALFGIKEIGRASPAVRTKQGWDVIAWTDVEPAAAPTPDELNAKLLPDVKQLYFNTWVNHIAQELHVHVEIQDANLAKLETIQ